MSALGRYLWCQVLRGPTEGLHGGAVRDPLFTQPKVCYLYVAILVQHEILQLHRERFQLKYNRQRWWESACVTEALPLNPCKLRCVSEGTPVLTLFLHHRIWLCLL